MKVLTINAGWHNNRLLMLDDAKADAAYGKLKDALNTYERFGNDKEKSVSIIDEFGEATIKLEALVSVFIEDISEAADVVHVETATRNARLDAKIKLPVASGGLSGGNGDKN